MAIATKSHSMEALATSIIDFDRDNGEESLNSQ